MAIIRFNDALRLAAQAAQDSELPKDWPVRVVRDVYGRVRFAIDCEANQYSAAARERLEIALARLGAYATKGEVIFKDDLSNPDAIFKGPDWHLTTVHGGFDDEDQAKPDLTVSVLDRQIMGQDWLNPIAAPAPHPHRIVFYGVKGGVGRSTALAMVAYGLAREGKRVLLLDFDLESPGLSGLLLPTDRVAEFGMVDWFVEDAVGQGDSVLRNMVSDSPLADTTPGAIRVATAIGQGESAYLSKLARVYADVPGRDGRQGLQRFATRMQYVVQLLEAQEKPDVVLIDSRAGLHDVAAISITSLADTALLFATDSAQNWQGYEQLFAHWQHRPEVCAQVRDRLAIVQALAPKNDREGRSKAFLNHAYELLSSTLYDEIAPPTSTSGQPPMQSIDLYNPAMEDEAAPHFPIRVDWDEVFQEFDPKLRPEQGGVSEAEIEAKFGALISWVKSRISGAGNE
jgi:MinD-like ATPase involved in chromosome partitioning or flagellar assembly